MTDERPEAPWDSFGSYLRSQRQLAQLSLRQLADLTKVSNPYLSQIERGLHQPSVTVIKQLAQALNLSVGDLLAHAADIVTGDEQHSGTESSIRSDPRLSDSQKSALLAVYSSMVSESKARPEPATNRAETPRDRPAHDDPDGDGAGDVAR
jgi:transcriptional regulator with XRE-family HTH domain